MNTNKETTYMYAPHPYVNDEAFARIYNKAWDQEYCDRLPAVDKLLLPHLPQKAHLINLCCSTGQTVQKLINKGYQVTGIDEFQAMLNIAHQNAPNAKLICDDIRTFALPSIYDGAYCVTHGLDYIMTIEELTNVFKRVYQALLPDGLFLTFMRLTGHSEVHYNQNGAIIDGDIRQEYAWGITSHYHSATKISELQCTSFEMIEGAWQRSDFIWLLKSYSRREIEAIFNNIGFKIVGVYDEEGNLVEPEYNRLVYFLCRK
ncbi:class I SAM-dependent methyltransferase [Nostocaceae cyanobacterium CENA357]|uniref:Class I SAM-dependent methyltransferase n=1 Tax=Atlanticothrix silvestris CENA357 TaxID=1725252 RepID=A0A8J7HFF2_9CYAN|nr:class I SAM-dependent methyltransferase [Atlanticothrix silvestris]MBH8554247.1 class I SAM-dependent methyltransferase [Atlanticothrix silvestris CENA357]